MNDFDIDQSENISTRFEGLELSGVTLNTKEFDDCTFVDCDFSETTFSKCKFIDCHFIRCNLSVVKLSYSRLMDVVFENSKMIGVDWTKAAWPNIVSGSPVRFMKCILNDSSFYGLELRELVMDECKIHDADFREADLTEADFQYSDLSYSQFHHTNLSSANFVEATNYDIDINSNNVKGARFTRLEAVRLLEGLGVELVD